MWARSSTSSSSSSSTSVEEEWSAEEEEIGAEILEREELNDRWVSPVDDFEGETYAQLEEYLEQIYGFNALNLVKERAPKPNSIYHGIRLINYLRKLKAEHCLKSVQDIQVLLADINPSSDFWRDDSYLFTVMVENDSLLRLLITQCEEDDEEDVKVTPEPLPSEEYLRDQAALIAHELQLE